MSSSPGNFKSLFGPVPQPDTERINLTVNARELLAAFEQVISQFELTYDLAEGPITSEIGLEQPGRRYPDLEKAFEAAFPLNLEALPALDY